MNSTSRRHVLVASVVTVASGLGPVRAHAQSFPDKPIRLVVPFTAGGGTDVLGRLLARAMSQSLGQQVVVDNVTGAGGTIGAMQVARGGKDGYTLMVGTPGSMQINPAMQSDLRYSPEKDFLPLSQFSDSPIVLVVNRETPWNTVREMADAARAKPSAINFGSAGIGSISHFSAELFQMLAKVKLTHVPYRGTAQAFTDLLSAVGVIRPLESRRIQATPARRQVASESAYTGHDVIGIYRPVQSRHKPATA